MTAEHLRVLLHCPVAIVAFSEVATALARADVPDEIMDAIRLGRLTVLRKPNGGVRGIVVRDIVRRLVGRTMAQQFSKRVEVATSPFQYALSTRAGTECVIHVLQTLTDLDERATILSVDGIGAYDLISRHAMLSGLHDMEDGPELLPFVSSFYGRPSTYLWEDELGVVHDIQQGEGGEQGDALMPMLFSLGQHRALEAIAEQLQENEKLFAFLDDIYVVCDPDRVGGRSPVVAEGVVGPCTHLVAFGQDTSVEPSR